MDWLNLIKNGQNVLHKYRYAILVLAAGLLLMLLPEKMSPQTENAEIPERKEQVGTAEELTEILGQIKGVGKVRVMLTVASGEMTVYQTDEDTQLGESGTIRHDTVIVSDSDRNESGLIQQVIPAQFRGALVVCEGGDHPSVCLAVVEAVSKLTGLSSDRISVLKMK